ncbi:hypothetical protein PssvBMR2_gp03 [Pseudomonas phage MR2]|uniref:Uncharacterized protein n=1 Tax=Pseudomonas phage MR2 TaxID=2711170 RepID=A0A6M3T8Q1_9CAUD|nr:hypothetical protein PssvBMR2_gp03 [Pseudomonas phage MR2]
MHRMQAVRSRSQGSGSDKGSLLSCDLSSMHGDYESKRPLPPHGALTMSQRTKALQDALDDLEARIKLACNAHEAAKSTFGRFEGPASHPMWEKLRNDVDSTLTHKRVLQAVWHRTKADLLGQQIIDHEA